MFNLKTISDETFDGTWPYPANFTNAPGFEMHYVEEGNGETLLCLHGEPTWGYLFRHLIKTLSEKYRVIVPDHMGFGKSDSPQDKTYFLQDHIDNIEQFVLDLDLQNITLIMHDFGGPVGMGLAIRHPERIKRIVSTNGPTPLDQSTLGEKLQSNGAISPWFNWIISANTNNTLESILEQLHYNILSTLKLNGFENNNVINNNWIQAYASPFKYPEHCLGAIGWAKGFAEGAHRFESSEPATTKLISKIPSMAIWGMSDQTLNPKFFIPLYKEAFPNGEIHRLEDVGHYCHEDAPVEISHLIDSFISKHN